ncbi:hypothetical protein LCGC14_0413870 [marine sediment metagenome]|uniref:Uncharacterized protein n=1 Tax=marine sediment metagenome TaxID=412755 RepID=A0A0F9VEU2_9ZZZZ
MMNFLANVWGWTLILMLVIMAIALWLWERQEAKGLDRGGKDAKGKK